MSEQLTNLVVRVSDGDTVSRLKDIKQALKDISAATKGVITVNNTYQTTNHNHAQTINNNSGAVRNNTRVLNDNSNTFRYNTRVLNDNSNNVRNNTRVINDHSVNVRNNTRVLNDNSVAINNNANNLRGLSGAAANAIGSFGNLNSILATVASTSSLLYIAKTADDMQSLNSQIKQVTASEAEYAAVKQRLNTLANETRKDIGATINLYTNSARAMANMGKSQQQVLDFTRNISLAMTVGGKSANEQKAALLQLGQAMQSGVFQGDEFRSISENAPVLLDLVAKHLNKTRGEVRELSKEGKITAQVVVDSLSGATKELEKRFSEMPLTMSQSWTIGMNSVKNGIDNFMNATNGISQAVGKTILYINSNFESLARIAGAVVVGALGKYVVSVTAATLANKGFTASAMLATNMAAANAIANRANAIAIGTYTAAMTAFSRVVGGGGTVMANLTAQTTLSGRALVLWTAYANAANAAGARLWATTSGLAAASGRQAATGIATMTGGLLNLGRIINAHPLMILAGVIFSIVASTEGFDGALKSLGDALGVVGILAKDLVEGIGKGIVGITKSVSGFINSLISGTKNGADKGKANLSVFFEGTKSGFTGIIQGVATMVDAAVLSLGSIFEVAINGISNVVISIKNGYNNVKGFLGGTNNHTEYNSVNLADVMAKNDGIFKNGLRSKVDGAIETQDRNKAIKQEKDLIAAYTDLTNTNRKLIDTQTVNNITLKDLPTKAGATSHGNVTKATADFARVVKSVLGNDLIYFSAFNDNSHAKKNSHHNVGQAFDLSIKSGVNGKTQVATVEKILQAAQQSGHKINILDEYLRPSKDSTGGHIHVTVLGKYGELIPSQVTSGGLTDEQKKQNDAQEKAFAKINAASDKKVKQTHEFFEMYKGADIANKHGIDPAFLETVLYIESGGKANAISPAGAKGAMQLMPATAKRMANLKGFDKIDLSDNGIFDPVKSLELGARYIAFMRDTYKTVDPLKLVAGYNAGESVIASGRRPDETKKYIKDTQQFLPFFRNVRKEGTFGMYGGMEAFTETSEKANDFLIQQAKDNQKALDSLKDLYQSTEPQRIDSWSKREQDKIDEAFKNGGIKSQGEYDAMTKELARQAQLKKDKNADELKNLVDSITAYTLDEKQSLILEQANKKIALKNNDKLSRPENKELLDSSLAEIDKETEYKQAALKLEQDKRLAGEREWAKTSRQLIIDNTVFKLKQIDLSNSANKIQEKNAAIELMNHQLALDEQTNRARLNSLTAYAKTEQERINDAYTESVTAIKNSNEIYKEEALKAAKYKYEQDSALAKANLQEQKNALTDYNKSAIQKIHEKWDVERQRAIATGGELMSLKLANIGSQESQEVADSRTESTNKINSLQSDLYGGKEQLDLKLQMQERYNILKEGLQNEAILRDEANKVAADIEKSYFQQSAALKLSSYSSVFNTMMSLTKAFKGEQSKTYRALFYAEKAFTLTSILLSKSMAIAKAYATGGFGGAVMSFFKSGAAQAVVQALVPKGFAIGGYTGNGNVNDVAGWVHGQEYVMNARATREIGIPALNAMNNGYKVGNAQPVINIHDYGGNNVSASVNSAGEIDVLIEQKVNAQMSSLADPNSTMSRMLKQHTTARNNY